VQRHFHRFTSFALLAIVGGVVAMAIFGPAPAAPAKTTPTDTFTHIDVAVSDHAITVSGAASAGFVEVTVTDHRSNQRTGLVVTSKLGVLTYGTQLNLYRRIGNYTLRSGAATGVLSVVVPSFPVRDDLTLHVVIHATGFSTPGREVRREEPTTSFDSAIPQERDYTAVTDGEKSLVLENQSDATQTCGIPSVMPMRTIAPGARVKMQLTFGVRGRSDYDLQCTNGTFGIWAYSALSPG
jgi:hypothetical protein